VTYLGKLPKLLKVKISNTHAGDKGLKISLPKMSQLESFNASACIELSDLTLMQIVLNLKSIQTLELASCMRLTSTGITMLKTCTTLTHLNLNRTLLDDAALAELAWLTGLLEFHMSGCDGVSDEGLQAITAAKGLMHLNTNGCYRCNLAWGLAEAWPAMEVLKAAGTMVTDTGAEQWGGLRELRHVDLANTAITDRTVDALCDGAGRVAVLRVVGCSLTRAAARKARLVSKSNLQDQIDMANKLAQFGGIQIGSEADRTTSPKASDAKERGNLALDAEGNPVPVIGNPHAKGGVLPDRNESLIEAAKSDIVQRHDTALLHADSPPRMGGAAATADLEAGHMMPGQTGTS